MDGRNVARDDDTASTHPLAYVRRRHGWSYQDLARVIADHARALGVPMAARREKVWRWEHWGVVPEADSQRALARALGIPPRELEARPWPRWLPAHGGMPDGLPWTVEGSRSALSALVDDATTDPRGFPIADGPALRNAIADWDAAAAEGSAPGTADITGATAAGASPGNARVTAGGGAPQASGAPARDAAGGPAPDTAGGVTVGSAGAPGESERGAGSPAVRSLTPDAAAASRSRLRPPTNGGRVRTSTRVPAQSGGFPRGASLDDRPAVREAARPVPADMAAAGAVYAAERSSAVSLSGDGTGGPFPAADTVDDALLDWLEAGALGLRRLDDRLGGAAIRHRVEADLRLVARLLMYSAGRPEAERRLLAIGAGLAQLGGWAATDTGRHGSAQRHYLTGLRLAHGAGDRAMAAALWGGLAAQSVIAERPCDAVAAAQAAVRAASGASPAVRAMAASRLGRAHAATGAELLFRRAAAEAEHQLERAAADPGPAWLYWFGRSELAAQTGESLLDLGRADEAGTLLERALAAQEPGFTRDRALYCASAARAHALTGDIDRARALTREAAALGRLCGTPRLAAALDAVRPLLVS